jgi:hypothetical protein
MTILNFLPLLIWMLAFYALNLRIEAARASAVFAIWCIGTLIFLSVGIWITTRA